MYKEIGRKLKEKHGKDKPGNEVETPDFAKAMRQQRRGRDLSLEKLSELTGINKQTLHSIENYSIKNPSFANLEICTVVYPTFSDTSSFLRNFMSHS